MEWHSHRCSCFWPGRRLALCLWLALAISCNADFHGGLPGPSDDKDDQDDSIVLENDSSQRPLDEGEGVPGYELLDATLISVSNASGAVQLTAQPGAVKIGEQDEKAQACLKTYAAGDLQANVLAQAQPLQQSVITFAITDAGGFSAVSTIDFKEGALLALEADSDCTSDLSDAKINSPQRFAAVVISQNATFAAAETLITELGSLRLTRIAEPFSFANSPTITLTYTNMPLNGWIGFAPAGAPEDVFLDGHIDTVASTTGEITLSVPNSFGQVEVWEIRAMSPTSFVMLDRMTVTLAATSTVSASDETGTSLNIVQITPREFAHLPGVLVIDCLPALSNCAAFPTVTQDLEVLEEFPLTLSYTVPPLVNDVHIRYQIYVLSDGKRYVVKRGFAQLLASS